jgi:hypothetical protein
MKQLICPVQVIPSLPLNTRTVHPSSTCRVFRVKRIVQILGAVSEEKTPHVEKQMRVGDKGVFSLIEKLSCPTEYLLI